MWGVCLDINVPELFQAVVEYIEKDEKTAVLISPESVCNPNLESIKPLSAPPKFVYGARVSSLNHAGIEGSIAGIFWHFDKNRFYYKIEINGKLQSKRYFAEELTEV